MQNVGLMKVFFGDYLGIITNKQFHKEQTFY